VLIEGAPTDAITLIRQMKEAKLNIKYLHGWKGTWASEFSDALGRDANYVMPDPQIEMNPEAARNIDLSGGDWVWLETPQVKGERVRLRVKLVEGIDPRVVFARSTADGFPRGRSLTSDASSRMTDGPPREKICGSVHVRGTLCRIYK